MKSINREHGSGDCFGSPCLLQPGFGEYEKEKDKMQVTVIRSNRKSISIQINRDLTILVRAPKAATDQAIQQLLREKQDWILHSLGKMQERNAALQQQEMQPLTREEILHLADKAMKVIPERVAYYAEKAGVTYGRITIRNQKTRWGSCSGKGNLNFN